MSRPQKSNYSEKLRDPRWQKKRLEILERDNWRCQLCFDGESMLHVHHRRYIPSRDPWDYPESCLVTLCESCHESEKDYMNSAIDLLTAELKEKFFSPGIMDLASAINGLVVTPSTADLINWILTNDRLMEHLSNLYDEFLKSQKEDKNATN